MNQSNLTWFFKGWNVSSNPEDNQFFSLSDFLIFLISEIFFLSHIVGEGLD